MFINKLTAVRCQILACLTATQTCHKDVCGCLFQQLILPVARHRSNRRACCSLGLNRLLFSTFVWSSETSGWCCSFQRTEIRSQHQFDFGKRSGLGPSFKTTINNNSLGSHQRTHECVLVPSVCNRDDQDCVLLAVSVELSTQKTVEEG